LKPVFKSLLFLGPQNTVVVSINGQKCFVFSWDRSCKQYKKTPKKADQGLQSY